MGKYLILLETDEDEGDILHHKQKMIFFHNLFNKNVIQCDNKSEYTLGFRS